MNNPPLTRNIFPWSGSRQKDPDLGTEDGRSALTIKHIIVVGCVCIYIYIYTSLSLYIYIYMYTYSTHNVYTYRYSYIKLYLSLSLSLYIYILKKTIRRLHQRRQHLPRLQRAGAQVHVSILNNAE